MFTSVLFNLPYLFSNTLNNRIIWCTSDGRQHLQADRLGSTLPYSAYLTVRIKSVETSAVANVAVLYKHRVPPWVDLHENTLAS